MGKLNRHKAFHMYGLACLVQHFVTREILSGFFFFSSFFAMCIQNRVDHEVDSKNAYLFLPHSYRSYGMQTTCAYANTHIHVKYVKRIVKRCIVTCCCLCFAFTSRSIYPKTDSSINRPGRLYFTSMQSLLSLFVLFTSNHKMQRQPTKKETHIHIVNVVR